VKLVFVHIAMLVLLLGCTKPSIPKPIWINQADSLLFSDAILTFKTTGKKWNATIISFVQPLPLTVIYNDTGFTAKPEKPDGIIEGPAQICLSTENENFYYTVNLINKNEISVTDKDYRSPKTVNPDSSLMQQRMIHSIDSFRNLVHISGKSQYFFEEELALAPKAGTYRAIQKESLTSFYMQPGSAVTIPIKAIYDKLQSRYTVTAGPLKDQFNNTVADGTRVNFIYSLGDETYRTEVSLLKGFADLIIEANPSTRIKLQVAINNTYSKQINLTP
jgi:hypothetical protein